MINSIKLHIETDVHLNDGFVLCNPKTKAFIEGILAKIEAIEELMILRDYTVGIGELKSILETELERQHELHSNTK